jgi:C4-type Zn-finger protein
MVLEGVPAVSKGLVSKCPQCDADMIAPECSQHLSNYCVRNVWSCEACGFRFADTIYLYFESVDPSLAVTRKHFRDIHRNPASGRIAHEQCDRQARQT